MNTPTRNGKIARLPKAIREELNRRLDEGETGQFLVDWLNAQPEVRTAMETHFPAHPEIREQNLSEWRKGGFQDWLRQQEALALAERLYEEAGELQAQAQDRPPITEVLSRWLTSRYVIATREIEATEGPAGWRLLRQMCADLIQLRRAEQRDARLELDRARVELQRQHAQLERERFEARQEKPPRAGSRTAGENRFSMEGAAPSAPQSPDQAPASTPDRPWQDCSDEEKLAWARRPENIDRVNYLNEQQHIARMKEIFRIK